MGSRIRNHGFSDAARPGASLSGSAQSLSARRYRLVEALRTCLRLLILLLTLIEIAARFALLRRRCGTDPDLALRARWLHDSCRKVLRRLRVRTVCRGALPSRGLICSNHLSYLDILVYAAELPCIFVSREDVSRWPVFGFFARAGGTLFIDRQSRASTEAIARQIADALAAEVPVLLFPEGTSTDGSSVLRFHPSLLEPASILGIEMTGSALAYRVRGGEERELCWYGDVSFLPHLFRTLGRSGMMAEIEFHPDRVTDRDRKRAAVDLHDKVEALRTRMKRSSPSG